MENTEKRTDPSAIIDLALELGAYRAEAVSVAEIKLHTAFRDMCRQNLCGLYGRCHTCPPAVGDILDLMKKFREYGVAVVYQTVGRLEDSFDFESMEEAKNIHNTLAFALREKTSELGIGDALHLAAGGCRVCERCAGYDGEPCRAPHLAMSSLEAYGVDVSALAALAGMKYINGQNTVTYFGAVLLPVEH